MRRHSLTALAGLAGTTLLCGALSGAAAIAQNAPAPAGSPATAPSVAPGNFEEQIEVTEVLLDAQVTDKSGNVIVGLGPGDFHVTEGGKPVQITDVRFYSSRPQLNAAGKQTTPAESQRFYIVLFHDQRHMNTEIPGVLNRQLDAGRRVHEWVNKLAGGDLVAIASYNTSLVIEQDFTADHTLLQKGIDRAIRGSETKGNWPSRLPPEGGPSLLRHLPKGEALRDQTTRIQGAFEVLAEASKPLVGRKNLIMFSTGYGRVNNFGQYQPDPVYDPPAQKALNDANIAVYTIDLLQSQAFSPLQDSMSDLSDVTGGRFFHNIVNFVTPLEQIAEETSGYYMLAYQATHPRGTSGYQPVKVTVTNPEFRVKAREGYLYGEATR